MAAGRGRGGASRSGSNHPALACASAAPPCPRRRLFFVYLCCHVFAAGRYPRSKGRGLVASAS